jgi:hypothetical protein
VHRRFGSWLVALGACLLITPASGATTFGAFGDSLTDEYIGQAGTLGATNLPALNWVQLLVGLRGVDFGHFEADPLLRGEPQNEGYAYNWARSGATAMAPGLTISNLGQQVTTAVPLIDSGAVDIAYVGIGSNDYFLRDFIQKLPMTGPGYDQWEADLIDAIFAGITRLQANDDVSIILAELPLGTAGGAGPEVIAAIAHTNVLLRDRAASLNIPVVDMFAWNRDPSRVDPAGNISFAGGIIASGSVASLTQTVPAGTSGAGVCDCLDRCATLAYAFIAIASDRIHPNTFLQALMANEFIAVANAEFGADIAPLTDTEVAALVPEPGTGLLFGLGLAGLGLRRTRRTG